MRPLLRPLLAVLPLAALLLGPSVALAQTCTTEWAQPVDGDWAIAANWSAGVPGTGDTACITVAGTYTVSVFSVAQVRIAGLIVGGASGTQTLVSNADFGVSGDARVEGLLRTVNRSFPSFFDLNVGGTLLPKGVIEHGGASARLMPAGGTLDVAASGTLRYVREQAPARPAASSVRWSRWRVVTAGAR